MRNCWTLRMHLCPLEALMACDIRQPVGADCTTDTDLPPTTWIWASEMHTDVDDVDAFSELGRGRVYAGRGNNTVNEADWSVRSAKYRSFCCIQR